MSLMLIYVLWTILLGADLVNPTCIKGCKCRIQRKLVTLQCTNIGLEEFPANISSSTQFLILDQNNITEIPQNLAVQLPRLQYLFLTGNRISKLQDYAFRRLQDLRMVQIDENIIQDVGAEIFSGVNSSKLVLNLQHNRISRLHSKTFNGYTGLIEINLANNELELLSGDVFSPLKHLEALHLDGNKLKTIPTNLFKDNPKLYYLNLRQNQIETFSDSSFHGLTGMMTLNLEDNKFETLPISQLLEVNRNATVTIHGNKLLCYCDLKESLAKHPRVKRMLTDIDDVVCSNDKQLHVRRALTIMNCSHSLMCETCVLGTCTQQVCPDILLTKCYRYSYSQGNSKVVRSGCAYERQCVDPQTFWCAGKPQDCQATCCSVSERNILNTVVLCVVAAFLLKC